MQIPGAQIFNFGARVLGGALFRVIVEHAENARQVFCLDVRQDAILELRVAGGAKCLIVIAKPIVNASTVQAPDIAQECAIEVMPVVPPALTTAESLVPYLKKCGYGDAQIMQPFNVDEVTIPVAAFAGRPFDSWSACIAAVNLNGDSKESATRVRMLGASTVFVCGPQGVDWWAMGFPSVRSGTTAACRRAASHSP